jgi:hypothetical protein
MGGAESVEGAESGPGFGHRHFAIGRHHQSGEFNPFLTLHGQLPTRVRVRQAGMPSISFFKRSTDTSA